MSRGESDRATQADTGELQPRPEPRESSHREEERKLRRLQIMMQFLLASIAQDRSMTVEDAAHLVAHTRNAALRMFPDKELAFNLLCRPSIQRAMRERFQIQ